MRLRVLELPMEHTGEFSKTPFALVIDRCDDPSTFGDDDRLKEKTGAAFILIHQGEVELD